MDYNEEDFTTRPRRPVVPSLSSRTLQHPSFQALYVAAAFGHHHHRGWNEPTVGAISPAEFFYTDPTISGRIPNLVTELRVTDTLQLNTPPPVMSACLAPPNRPDPFRSGWHPTRDLGGSEWIENPFSTPGQPRSCYVVQLTQEEDQVITNLLKLHHTEFGQRDETQMEFEESPVKLTASFPHSHHQPVILTLHSDEEHQHQHQLGLQNPLQQRRRWSDAELEAADTLLSCCCVEEEDQERGVMLPVLPLPSQHNEDLVKSTEVQPGSETLTTYFTHNDSCINENREPSWRNFRSVEDRSVSKVKQSLSDSEGDALCVLLSLGDAATVNILH